MVFLVVSFPLALHPIIYMRSSSTHSCYMPRPSHPPRLYSSNYTWRKVQIMKLLIMQFYPSSCHLISPRSRYSLHPLLNHPQSVSLSNVKDQVSYPHKSIGHIIVLQIIIFTFLDSRLEQNVNFSKNR
jgi:hypothetical protein